MWGLEAGEVADTFHRMALSAGCAIVIGLF
jgi:hypothetical protein